MERLRLPFFIAALALAFVVALVELGAAGVLGAVTDDNVSIGSMIPPPPPFPTPDPNAELRAGFNDMQSDGQISGFPTDKPPGFAIRTMALADGILFFTMALMGLGLLIGEAMHARIQGIITLIFSIVIIVLAIVAILAALVKLLLMVALFLAIPFGTLAYLAGFGSFNRGGASVTLGLLMSLKIAFAVCLVLAHQRFLQNKGLIFMVITAFLVNVIVSFLHGLVPIFLVSITDALAAIVVGIIALIWAILLLIGAIPAILKAIPPSASGVSLS